MHCIANMDGWMGGWIDGSICLDGRIDVKID